MSTVTIAAPEVFSAREIARAAAVSPRQVKSLMESGRVPTLHGCFVAAADAIRAVRFLRGADTPTVPAELFSPPPAGERSPGRALAASGALHAAMLGAAAFVTTLGLSTPPAEIVKAEPARLVFLATPGPGGGGGGGGLRQPAPPPAAKLAGAEAFRSPVPPPRPKRTDPKVTRTPPPPPVRPQPVEQPVEPPPAPVRTEPLPQVVAPVATAAADVQDKAGELTQTPAATASNGPGTGGGSGSGSGTGIGEGDGSGIGPGSGGGTGGGPYRAGSGVTAPGILREVKPDYTEEARRRGLEGDVVLEIVVRRNGSVGEVRMLQGLGSGLDQRAIDAVRQWRFSPAQRMGTPVDVMVEVAVEFRLR